MDFKTKLKGFFSKIGQTTYLTSIFYFENNLGNAASACTFGFIFSFIPILMVIITSCIGIIKINPAIAEWIINWSKQFNLFFNVEEYINRISGMHSITGINIVLAFFIIWMARKLFASIISGMANIFRKKAPVRPIFNQLLTFIGEILLVLVCAVVFFTTFISRQILTLPLFEHIKQYVPILFSNLSNNIVLISFYSVLFIFTSICYRVMSGTKPPIKLCLLNSILCIVVFYVVVTIISKTINKANYSTIYGALSSMMILLFEVWFFFIIFMTCAQILYVEQFFDSLLIGELYLMPEHDKTGLFNTLRRVLFITPSSLMKKDNIVNYNAGEPIYTKDSEVEFIYFIVEGQVSEYRNQTEIIHEKGTSFGEPEFMLNSKRISESYAKTPCTILQIPSHDFSELIEKNPKAAAKAMSSISYYTEKLIKNI